MFGWGCNISLGGAVFNWGCKLLKAMGRILTELHFGGNQLPSIAIWQLGDDFNSENYLRHLIQCDNQKQHVQPNLQSDWVYSFFNKNCLRE